MIGGNDDKAIALRAILLVLLGRALPAANKR